MRWLIDRSGYVFRAGFAMTEISWLESILFDRLGISRIGTWAF